MEGTGLDGCPAFPSLPWDVLPSVASGTDTEPTYQPRIFVYVPVCRVDCRRPVLSASNSVYAACRAAARVMCCPGGAFRVVSGVTRI